MFGTLLVTFHEFGETFYFVPTYSFGMSSMLSGGYSLPLSQQVTIVPSAKLELCYIAEDTESKNSGQERY